MKETEQDLPQQIIISTGKHSGGEKCEAGDIMVLSVIIKLNGCGSGGEFPRGRTSSPCPSRSCQWWPSLPARPPSPKQWRSLLTEKGDDR